MCYSFILLTHRIDFFCVISYNIPLLLRQLLLTVIKLKAKANTQSKDELPQNDLECHIRLLPPGVGVNALTQISIQWNKTITDMF